MAATYPPNRTPRPPRMPEVRESPRIERTEPGKFPAAVLALFVHVGFFAVIVFGVSWQVKHPEPVMAELWDQLPTLRKEEPPAPEPEVKPPPPEPEVKKVVEPPVEKPVPPQPTKADIQLKLKKEKAEKDKLERERLEKQKEVELEKKRKEDEAKKKLAKIAEDKAKAEQANREAAANAARNAAMQDYALKIAALIRSRANIPDTVSGKPALTVRLRLLVNGVVFDAQVIKPSGNRVYDEAVERAINGIRQWPLPENPEIFGGRRELTLNFEHER